MELVVVSLGGALVVLVLQLTEFFFSAGRRLRHLALKSAPTADASIAVPGF